MEELLTASDYGSSDQYHCRDSDRLICYLLDDGAFVISTNQEDKLGAVSICCCVVSAQVLIE